ncbi:MAG: hypothetical protein CSYNP_01658 [Syntrophus sp. SKADARSKE-3]|nr:hypothetical protein [Syntrophus sp. SKADARSKE-3]
MKLSKWIRPITSGEATDEKKMDLSGHRIVFLIIFWLLISLLLGILLSQYVFVSLPTYKAGDIARMDIVVPEDDLIIDERATDALRSEAIARVLPIFRYDGSMHNQAVKHLAVLFSQGRGLMARLKTAGVGSHKRQLLQYRLLPDETKTQIQAMVEAAGIKKPSEELLNFLVSEEFNAEMEKKLLAALQQGFSLPIIDDTIPLHGKNRLTMIDKSTQREGVTLFDSISTREQSRGAASQILIRNENVAARYSEEKKIVEAFLMPDLTFDLQETQARQAKAAANVNPVLRKLKKGQIIVRHGDEINRDDLVQIDALRKFSHRSTSIRKVAGTSLLIASFLLVNAIFLRFFHAAQWGFFKLALLFGLIITVNVMLLKVFWFIGESVSQRYAGTALSDQAFFFYVLPYAAGTMNMTLLAGESSALLFLIFSSPLAGQAVGSDYSGLIYIVITGLLGILSMRNVTERLGIIEAGFKTGLPAAAVFIIIQFAKQSPPDAQGWALGSFFAFLSGSLNAGILAFTLPLLERLFTVTTEIRLSELGNVNFPVVQQLIVKAPGTYNHSIIVGTLCEGAAAVLGLSPLFMRVAGLYHDIGKTVHPEYFIENQRQGNPHDQIDPLKSAAILREHVKAGMRIASEAGLPESIVELIPQHHGTKLMYYFWEKAKKNAAPGEEIDEEKFRHSGPKPQSKAAAVLMLADGVEAAARTLDNTSQENLLAVIKEIISSTAEDGQLAECDITIAEIDRLTFSFLDTLSNYYHIRVAYPGFDFNKQESAP